MSGFFPFLDKLNRRNETGRDGKFVGWPRFTFVLLIHFFPPEHLKCCMADPFSAAFILIPIMGLCVKLFKALRKQHGRNKAAQEERNTVLAATVSTESVANTLVPCLGADQRPIQLANVNARFNLSLVSFLDIYQDRPEWTIRGNEAQQEQQERFICEELLSKLTPRMRRLRGWFVLVG